MLVYNRQTNRGGGAPSIPDIADYAGVIFLDQFTGVLSVGNVDGTLSSDGNAKRVVIDPDGVISINDSLIYTGGTATKSTIFVKPDDSKWDAAPGLALIARYDTTNVDQNAWPTLAPDQSITTASSQFPSLTTDSTGTGGLALNHGGGYQTKVSWTATTRAVMPIFRTQKQPTDRNAAFGLVHISGQTWRILAVSLN